MLSVALLAEGVDRNQTRQLGPQEVQQSPSSRRAWIEIPVFPLLRRQTQSPSSRRAWIEIPPRGRRLHSRGSPSSRRAWIEIAHDLRRLAAKHGSPSSRRAWIEITARRFLLLALKVALLAEGVDRNFDVGAVYFCHLCVALLAEGVDRNPCICGL